MNNETTMHKTHHRPQDIVSDEITHPATSASRPQGPSGVPLPAPKPRSGATTLTEKIESKAHALGSKAESMVEDARERMDEMRPEEQHSGDPYSVTVDEAVVEKIASRTVRHIDGIVDLKGGPLSKIQDNLGTMPNRSKGTYATIDGNDVSILVCAVLRYGTPANDVFEAVKKDVIPEVESLTGLNVKELTVKIVSVMDDEEIEKMQNKPTAKETATSVASTLGSSLSNMAGTVLSSVEAARNEAARKSKSA